MNECEADRRAEPLYYVHIGLVCDAPPAIGRGAELVFWLIHDSDSEINSRPVGGAV